MVDAENEVQTAALLYLFDEGLGRTCSNSTLKERRRDVFGGRCRERSAACHNLNSCKGDIVRSRGDGTNFVVDAGEVQLASDLYN